MALPNIASVNTYGGLKENDRPVENPVTDEDAEERNEYVADVAGMTQTIDRAWCRFVGHGTQPTYPSSNVHSAVWGNDDEDKPVYTRTGTGVVTIEWPDIITDERGVEIPVNLRNASVNVEGSTLYFANATVTAPNVVTVRIWNSSGVLNDAVGVTLGVRVS